jgi:hypothetical protein
MLIEQRLTWVDQVVTNRSRNADIISFGSESCVIPFLDINNHWEVFLSLIDLGIRLKLVTPRISQSELPDTIHLLHKIIALRRPIDIVLNDWGIMQFCFQNKDRFNIHVGRQLCRSLLDCPWHREILDNESSDVGEIIASHPFSNMGKIKSLHIQGVKGLELNALSRSFNLQTVIDLDLEIAVQYETYLLTCGRTCLTKRIVPDRECRNLCEGIFQLEPSGKWLNYFENRDAFNGYEKTMLSGLAVNGKKVTLPQKANIDDMLSCSANVVIATQTNTINLLRRRELK